jgi:hypothetical protein
MDICGWVLESIVVREFRLAQGPATDCVTFFRNSDGRVAKIFLDDEDCTWKIEESSENPSSDEVLGDSYFEYRHRNFGLEHDLIGATVEGWDEADLGESAVGRLYLQDGRMVVFTYAYHKEKETLFVKCSSV